MADTQTAKAITTFLKDLVKITVPGQSKDVDDSNFKFAARILASQVPGSKRLGHPMKDGFRIKQSMFRFLQQKTSTKESVSSSSLQRDQSNRLSDLLQRLEKNPVLTRPWYATVTCLKPGCKKCL